MPARLPVQGCPHRYGGGSVTSEEGGSCTEHSLVAERADDVADHTKARDDHEVDLGVPILSAVGLITRVTYGDRH